MSHPPSPASAPSPLGRSVDPSPALSAFDPGFSPASTAATSVYDLPPLDLDRRIKEVNGGKRLPDCWGHRGASAAYPENTRMSFIEACKAGAGGIETDIHVTKDGRLVMFHDPDLGRTTDGQGRITELPWEGVIEHVRTRKTPVQPIPLFSEVLEILMMPENRHVKLNLDCKPENKPDILFALVRKQLEAFPDWEVELAPRIILGIWHPAFIPAAQKHLPALPIFAIVMSTAEAERYFWHGVAGFSVWFARLQTATGRAFLARAEAEGKAVCAWTVNDAWEMERCIEMGVHAVITDKPGVYVELANEILKTGKKPKTTLVPNWLKTWSSLTYYTVYQNWESDKERAIIEIEGGPFVVFPA